MGLAMGQMTNQKNESENTVIQAPRPSELLQWAQIIAPAAVQTFGILANKQMATSRLESDVITRCDIDVISMRCRYDINMRDRC